MLASFSLLQTSHALFHPGAAYICYVWNALPLPFYLVNSEIFFRSVLVDSSSGILYSLPRLIAFDICS